MKPVASASDRWRRIEELFHAARERTPASREAFLREACAGEAALEQEVRSLLEHEDGSLFQDGLAGAAAAVSAREPQGALEGRRLGPYVLGPLLGAGGMGEVYRARDDKLGRDVAVKILPDADAESTGSLSGASRRRGVTRERLARFEREARVLAALNHPNIAAIYGLETSERLHGIVLELVDGLTLAELLGRGALPVERALTLARQIATALQAAHQKGIVHRDLKPANIKITPAGVVKVLDFGLAKIEWNDERDAAALPVLETHDGLVLGTVAYMSPEQARGQTVDKRTDIWAFGCVLYEMFTGRRPFAGESAADVLGALTTTEPDWTRLPSGTPRRVREVLRRCLVKDADRRLHDIADARIEIEDAIADPKAEEDLAGASPPPAVSRRTLLWVAGVLSTAVAALAIWAMLSGGREITSGPTRVAIPLRPEVSVFAIGRGSSVAVSPDGRSIVYAGIVDGRRQLYLRRLDADETVPIAGSEDAASPSFSPDGRWVVFLDNTPAGSLKRLPVEGGTALTVVANLGDRPRGYGVQSAAWGPDTHILFSAMNPARHGLWRVSATGGTPEPVSAPVEGELFHTWPQVLPGGRVLLYTVWNNTGFDGGSLAVRPLTGGEPSVLVEGASYGRVVSPDWRRAWLVYARPEGLHAAPFDLGRLRLAGPSALVQDGVLVNLSGGAHFSVSATGVLAYVPGGLDELNKTALWVARDGSESEIGVIPGLGFQYRLSPDGRRLARVSATGPFRDLWVEDLERRSTPIRLTSGAAVNLPVWTPDGQRIIYALGLPAPNLFWRAADGSGIEERLTTSPHSQHPSSVSPDGRTLVYFELGDDGSADLWVLSLESPREPRRVLGTPFGEVRAKFSPDGRWLAYQSNTSGRFEIYLTPVSGGGRQISVSSGGGNEPIWSRDGRELYYRSRSTESATGHMMAVSIDLDGPEPRVGTPRELFANVYQGDGDVAPDGRFLLLQRTPQESPSRVIQLVLNWFDELQAKVPLP